MTHEIVGTVGKAEASYWKTKVEMMRQSDQDVKTLKDQLVTVINAIRAVDGTALALARTAAYVLSKDLLRDEPSFLPDDPWVYEDLDEQRLQLFPLICEIQAVKLRAEREIESIEGLLDSLFKDKGGQEPTDD